MESFGAEVESARLGEKFGGFTGIRIVPLILSCRTVSARTVCGKGVRFLVECFAEVANLAVESGLAADFFAESSIAGPIAESAFGAPA